MSSNGFGYVVTEGRLSGIDTSTATAGDAVWLSSTAGGITFGAPPTGSVHTVYIGVVTKANASTGEILVKVQNGYELDELHDVSAASPDNNDVLQFVSSTGLWTKKSLSGAGIAASSHTHPQSDVTNLTTDLGLKAPSASPTFTGTITTPLTTAGYVKTDSSGVLSSSAAIAQADVTNLTTDLSAKAVGAASSTDNTIPRFDGTGGKTLQTSSIVVNDSNVAFFPTATAFSPVTITKSSGTYTIDMGSSNYFKTVSGTASTASFVNSSSAGFTSSTTGTLTLPSSMQQGDLCIVAIASDGSLGSTSSSGWSTLYSDSSESGGVFGTILYKVMGSTPDTSIAITGISTASAAVAHAWRNVGIYTQNVGYAKDTTGNPDGPSTVTLGTNETVLVFGFLDDDAVTMTAPSGYTNSVFTSSGSGVSIGLVSKTISTAGTSEDPAAFGGTGTDSWLAVTALLYPKPEDVTVTLSSHPTQSITGYNAANARSAIIEYDTSDCNVTWDSKIKWRGSAPLLKSKGYVVVYTTDGGTNYRGIDVNGY
jgi:hypothetical protein